MRMFFVLQFFVRSLDLTKNSGDKKCLTHACRGLNEKDVQIALPALNSLDWLSAAFCGVGIWCLSPFMPWGNVQAVLAFITLALG